MSSLTTLARPYAKAAFDVALSAQTLDSWANSLSVAGAIAADERVQELTGDPRVENMSLKTLFINDEDPQGYDNFLSLLVENDRLSILPEIARLFLELKAEAEQTLNVTVRSAVAIDDAYKAKLTQGLEARFGKRIILETEIDTTVLGGAIIQAGDQVIDGSLRGKLTRLAESLTS